jgi:DNA-directed RNA polymerase specialized sigma24 family protein
MRALERENQFQPQTRLDSWVFRIAQSVWFNQRRADRVRRGGGLVPAEDAGLIASPSFLLQMLISYWIDSRKGENCPQT